MSRFVLNVELVENTNDFHVQNERVDNSIGFFFVVVLNVLSLFFPSVRVYDARQYETFVTGGGS